MLTSTRKKKKKKKERKENKEELRMLEMKCKFQSSARCESALKMRNNSFDSERPPLTEKFAFLITHCEDNRTTAALRPFALTLPLLSERACKNFGSYAPMK